MRCFFAFFFKAPIFDTGFLWEDRSRLSKTDCTVESATRREESLKSRRDYWCFRAYIANRWGDRGTCGAKCASDRKWSAACKAFSDKAWKFSKARARWRREDRSKTVAAKNPHNNRARWFFLRPGRASQLFSPYDFFHVFIEWGKRILVFYLRQNHDFIRAVQIFDIQPVRFAQKPLDPVSLYAFSVLLAHGYREKMFFRREIQKRKTARKRALSVSEKLLYFRLFFQPFILHLSTRFSCVPPRFFAGFRRLSIKRTAAYAEKRQKCGFFSAFFSAEMLFETRFLSRHAAFFHAKITWKAAFFPCFFFSSKHFFRLS